jgi:large subunit ribosomal protein L29
MEYKDIKDLSQAELGKKKKAAVAELFQLQMRNSLGQLPNPLEIRKARRDLARVNTALTTTAGQKPVAKKVKARKGTK